MLTISIYFILACVMQLTIVLGFKIITEHQKKIHKKYFLLIFPIAIILTIENYFNLIILSIMTSLLSYFILNYLIYRRSRNDTIFYCVALSIIGLILDSISMILSTIIPFERFHIDITTIRYIDTCFMQLVLLLLLNWNCLKKILNKLNQSIKKIKFPYISFILILIVLSSMGLSFLSMILENGLKSITMPFIILSFSIIILVVSFIYHEYNNNELKIINKNLIKNNDFYITVVNDYRVLKHNIIHQLNGIKSVSNKKATTLINDLMEEYNTNFKNLKIEAKMPSGINGIVYEKIYTYPNQDFRLEIDNSIESDIFNNLTPKSYNLLCEALGVLLDNALEASEKSKEKIIMIDMKETEESYNIKIINTFDEILDLEKIGTMKYTTKNYGHGIGLYSLIGRKKLKIKTSIINDLFFNEIIIEKKLK